MSVYQKYIYHLFAPQRALEVIICYSTYFRPLFQILLIPRHRGAYPRPYTSISKDWPSLMESLEMRKARFSKLIYCRKEKFENKGRFPIPSGQLQIREGVFSGWEHCHIQKGVLEPRDGGGQIPKLWVGGGQES